MSEPKITRVLLAALGGEGGGVLMNWIVAAARAAGHDVQATSVPGVAQRTGSTSYYVEIADLGAVAPVFSLVPLRARVDAVVASELVEAARVMAAGFVSPDRTTLIASTARFYSTAEKIAMGDGRFPDETVRDAAEAMAQTCHLLDLGALAADSGTYVSATMYGALTGSGVLPWDVAHGRSVLGDARSQAGFDAAVAAVHSTGADGVVADLSVNTDFSEYPNELAEILHHSVARLADYQDAAYADTFLTRTRALIGAADLADHRALNAVVEACRRLALWMAYEDIARVADLKTRPDRFDQVRDEVRLEPGQILTITEYMKPRAEEIADILPQRIGARIMARVNRGGGFPLLGDGRRIRSNGVIGYWLLRFVARLSRIRRGSYRFAEEQAAIEDWLGLMQAALSRSPDFALGLAELPRVLKGYSDTLARGRRAYARIIEVIVRPAIAAGEEAQSARHLREAIGAALADDTHAKLEDVLGGKAAPPILRPLSA